ncbi:uncharacterized protein LOC105219557 isoform X2 [Zeugodacus cucurbitae]|uniref:uncharacterized protein LOC105219557 isoform X2 n=1 Tax=Zeugodacus cucurbitae TaxID=28588 RepID=UPI0023D901B5|nr:uncharacterized protein LOC105219557 isoform X2 [Zeugodacus cucurbitae]
MAELMDAKLKKDKIRRREKPNKKWTEEEVGQVLNYLQEHPSFEMPSAQIFYKTITIRNRHLSRLEFSVVESTHHAHRIQQSRTVEKVQNSVSTSWTEILNCRIKIIDIFFFTTNKGHSISHLWLSY